ncbi:MAG: 7,8-didemethyl-8-hydroxy-5-deazariboflavin synthase subunit CofG [Oculatellaceae cyanobacterium bins.114]|nr:7,8-didemethyl-8-hydroxy-5-deazariboflavin synthase subunit CofG [Oculatellaceae cyanobacterium bins.114]
MLPVITFSPAYTVVPTYECFNACTYCNFRVKPGTDEWLSLAQAESELQRLRLLSQESSFTEHGVIEILVLSGEVHPHHPKRLAWFQRVYDLCDLALRLGFLPHTNVGPLRFEEMAALRHVNVSMGLMVEQVTPRLLQTVHKHAPSKIPEARLQQLEWAGMLKIPFTTGLLLGIGETEADWQDTLRAIAQIQSRWGHIQEVILQPHSPGQSQANQGSPFPAQKLADVVAIAREILPDEITLQIPPNLISDPSSLLQCLAAGARDLGGIGPIDEVNPDYPHRYHEAIATVIRDAGWQLVPRLPIYPQYDKWLPPHLQEATRHWRDRLS